MIVIIVSEINVFLSDSARPHTPVVVLFVGPGGPPAPVLHRQGHLFQVARDPVDKRRAYGLMVIRLWLGL